MNQGIRDAIRNTIGIRDENGLIRPDVCKRTFVLYLGNGYEDPSMNTPEGAQDVEVCAEFLRGRCYRQFHGGQMEQVLEDLISVSFIRSPSEVLHIVRQLRKMGIIGKIELYAEYIEGYLVNLKSY